MSNPTRRQINDAHEALSDLTYLADKYISATLGGLDETRELRQTILRALPPRPQPTMAEIEWDDNEHYLAEAEHSAWGKVIMLNKAFTSGDIRALINEDGAISIGCITPKYLTPTGKRYTLTEVQE